MPAIHSRWNTSKHSIAMQLLRIAFVSAILLWLTAAALAQEAWVTFVSPRFGTTVEYPADVFTEHDEFVDDGDVHVFRSRNADAGILIIGFRNTEKDTPKSYLERRVDLSGLEVSRYEVTDHFYAVAGERGGRVFYERCNFQSGPDGNVHCVGGRYPVAERAFWDPIVTRIINSLRIEMRF
jgi:hypothetical protein